MLYIRKLKLSEFEKDAQDPTGCLNGWTVYGFCSSEEYNSCQLLVRLLIMETSDAKHVIDGMAKLIKFACVGKPLSNMYDSTKCHEAFTFTLKDGSEHKVHRIWPGGKVRIYFTYGPDKTIFIFFSLVKNKDKLTKGEQKELQDACTELLTCLKAKQIRVVEKKNEIK